MKSLTLLAVLAAAPLCAQTVAPHRFAAAVQTTLVAMRDGVGSGAEVADAIEASGARVVAEAIPTPSALRQDPDGRPVIVLDSRVALAPRVLAPHIAREGAKLVLKDMPPSAEKEYMARSLMVRSWLELGGERGTLPVIDPLTGAADPRLAAEFKEWLDGDNQTVLERLGKGAGVENIPAQMDAARGGPDAEARLAALESANRRFIAFLRAEREWEMMFNTPR